MTTFQDARHNAFSMLGDVEDELRDWQWSGPAGPTPEQSLAMQNAMAHIRAAKIALDDAGRDHPRGTYK